MKNKTYIDARSFLGGTNLGWDSTDYDLKFIGLDKVNNECAY